MKENNIESIIQKMMMEGDRGYHIAFVAKQIVKDGDNTDDTATMRTMMRVTTTVDDFDGRSAFWSSRCFGI
jgi:hypothetical protein